MLAQSLCVSHLLFGAVIWAPTLPPLPALRYHPRSQKVAHTLQVAYNGLLRWALVVPIDTRLELLHILANLPPPATLLFKQLVRYQFFLHTESNPTGPSPPPPRHAR